MKKFILTIISCLLLQFVAATNSFADAFTHKVDSLKNVLASSKEDSNKVKTLINLAAELLLNNPEEGLSYSKQSLALAQKLNQTKAVICSYQNIAGYYYHRGNMEAAEQNSQKAIGLIKQTNNKKALADAYNKISAITSRRSDYTATLNFLKEGLDLAKEIKDTAEITTILCNTGITYMGVSDYTTAMNYFMDVLKISEPHNLYNETANSYLNIGKIYCLGYNNADKTITYSLLALKTAKQGNDQFTASMALQLAGDAYIIKKDWNKALNYFQQSLDINTRISNFTIMVNNMGSIASIYSEQKKFEPAIKLMLQAIALSDKIGDNDFGLGCSYGIMGQIYMAKNDYKTAIQYLNKSLAIARRIDMRNNETVALTNLATCYNAQKDYKSAFNAIAKYKEVRDSLISEESIKKTAQMEALYNFDKKEKEIALLTKDKQMQTMQITYLKTLFFAGFILFSILFLLLYRNYHIRQSLKLQTLRNKLAIDLHDEVGSTLSSISIFSEIARQQSKEVAPLLDQIRENCRKIIESMADIVWTINPENDNFENIIIRMRSFAYELLGTKKINFEFNTDESIANMKLPMDVRKNLYLIFKEATNNMVKYADANRASFSLTGTKNNLTMLITDNGKGFEPGNETNGNGLKNMKARALEMGAKFLIESAPGKGTTIQLLLKTA